MVHDPPDLGTYDIQVGARVARALLALTLTSEQTAGRFRIDTNQPARPPSLLRIRRRSRRPPKKRYKMPASRCLPLDYPTVQFHTPAPSPNTTMCLFECERVGSRRLGPTFSSSRGRAQRYDEDHQSACDQRGHASAVESRQARRYQEPRARCVLSTRVSLAARLDPCEGQRPLLHPDSVSCLRRRTASRSSTLTCRASGGWSTASGRELLGR